MFPNPSNRGYGENPLSPESSRKEFMKQFGIVLLLTAAFCYPATAAPLSSNARTVIPQTVQQIISVDYRELRDSPMAHALKDQVIPDSVKQFESVLRSVGIDPDRDAEQITFVTYRGPKTLSTALVSRKDRFGRRSFWPGQRPGRSSRRDICFRTSTPWVQAFRSCFLIPSPSCSVRMRRSKAPSMCAITALPRWIRTTPWAT